MIVISLLPRANANMALQTYTQTYTRTYTRMYTPSTRPMSTPFQSLAPVMSTTRSQHLHRRCRRLHPSNGRPKIHNSSLTSITTFPSKQHLPSTPQQPPNHKPPTKLTCDRSNKPFPCADCGKAFTRSADLRRHQTSVHYPVFQDCPVADCSRKGHNGFPRKDHLLEHLRAYHHVPVPKRGASKRVAKAQYL